MRDTKVTIKIPFDEHLNPSILLLFEKFDDITVLSTQIDKRDLGCVASFARILSWFLLMIENSFKC